MAKMNASFLLITCLLGSISVYVYGENSKSITPKDVNYWCVSQENPPANKLQGFLDYACSKADCVAIQPGGSCFEPNTLKSHASYALNIIYRIQNVCNMDIGTLTDRDPSYGECHYLGVAQNGGL